MSSYLLDVVCTIKSFHWDEMEMESKMKNQSMFTTKSYGSTNSEVTTHGSIITS
jgi:hypothetical protein